MDGYNNKMLMRILYTFLGWSIWTIMDAFNYKVLIRIFLHFLK